MFKRANNLWGLAITQFQKAEFLIWLETVEVGSQLTDLMQSAKVNFTAINHYRGVSMTAKL
jgi:hypothetical protein